MLTASVLSASFLTTAWIPLLEEWVPAWPVGEGSGWVGVWVRGLGDCATFLRCAGSFPMAVSTWNWSSIAMVSASDADSATSKCTLPPAGVPCEDTAGDAPGGFAGVFSFRGGIGDIPPDAALLAELLVSFKRMPLPLPSLPDNTSETELLRLEAAALSLAINPVRRRAGIASVFVVSVCPLLRPLVPADSATEDLIPEVELTVNGVAELGVDPSIARGPGTAAISW